MSTVVSSSATASQSDQALPNAGDHALEIRTAACQRCPACGEEGDYLHRGLSDRLFGAPGLWGLRRCARRDCQTLWLDPTPRPEDIGKAYLQYYTHSVRSCPRSASGPRRALRKMKQSYQAIEYGYPTDLSRFWSNVLGGILLLVPLRREDADHEVRFLGAIPGGRLLDVGCGTGEWLLAMRDRGWDVEGVEVDQNAVDAALGLGLEVRCGILEQMDYPDASFDAITLCHVIEHLPHMGATIAECARLLKPGGRLVISTPSSTSLSRRLFGRYWRGLEPPRHVAIFSPRALSRILTDAGLECLGLKPQRARQVVYESILLRMGLREYTMIRGGRHPWVSAWARAFVMFELPLIVVRPHCADCVTAVARKQMS